MVTEKASTIVRTVLAAVAMSAAASSGFAEQPGQLRVAFKIHTQYLEQALTEFGAASGLQVLFSTTLTQGKTAPTVMGSLSSEDALKKLLEGSALRYEFINSKTVAIRAAGPATGAPQRVSYADAPLSTLRLMQADMQTGQYSNDRVPTEAGVVSSSPPREKLDQVIITGTHLRDVSNTGSQLIVLDESYFERSGFSSLEDVIRTVPQVVTGPSQFSAVDGMRVSTIYSNPNRGTGINLRGFGANATLVLVDGLRQAASGTGGNFVDIAAIPLNAVERVEILTDGASATYGSDAVGGVVNIVMKRNYQGLETKARFSTYDGDADEYQISQIAGIGWGSGNAMISIEYDEREVLFAAKRSYARNSDQRANGGDNFSSIVSNPGNILCTTFDGSCEYFQPVFALPTGQDGSAITISDLIPIAVDGAGANLGNLNDDASLVPNQRKVGAYVRFAQEFESKTKINASFRYNHRPIDYEARNTGGYLTVPPSNPYYLNVFGDGQPLTVAYSFGRGLILETSGKTDTYNGSLGATRLLPRDWTATANVSYSRQSLYFEQQVIDDNLMSQALGNPPYEGEGAYDPIISGFLNPWADGTTSSNQLILSRILGIQGNEARWVTKDASAQIDGPMFQLPGGAARAALGISYRSETGSSISRAGGVVSGASELRQSVRAAYAEFALPFVGAANARSGVQELRLSVAGRYEDYIGYKSSFNPKFGINWSPHGGLGVRAMWGTSFRAPSPADRDTVYFNRSAASVMPVSDPTSPSGVASGLVLLGGVTPDLHEETARSWSAGMDLAPGALEGFRVSLTYYDTQYKDRIGTGGVPGQQLDLLQQEDVWKDIIVRNPSPELIGEFCGSVEFSDPGCAISQPDVVLDLRVRNIAVQSIRGADLQASQTIQTTLGVWNVDLNINRTFESETALTDNLPRVDTIDIPGAPLSWKGRLSAAWDLRDMRALATVNYTPSYTDPFSGLSQTERPVTSWTTVDLGFGYTSSRNGTWLAGTSIMLNIVNVADRAPPYLNTTFGYDPSNANPYGRLMSVHISKSW